MSQYSQFHPSDTQVDPILSIIREELKQYAARQHTISYLRSLCGLATKIDAAVKISAYHKDTLKKLDERISEVVYLLVSACSDIDCSNSEERVFYSNYMKHAGEDLMQLLQNIETFVSSQNGGTFGMVRYNFYGQYYDKSAIENYMASLYAALQPFTPPSEQDIPSSARMVAAMSMERHISQNSASCRPRSPQPNISFFVYYMGSGSQTF